MPRITLIAICLLFPAAAFAGDTAYDATLKGKKCTESHQQISCEYKVGRDLEFSIDGMGVTDTGVTFAHTNFNGDYYASIGMQHGCVIVKHGKSSPLFGKDFAFVSPKNGEVYRSWVTCKQGM